MSTFFNIGNKILCSETRVPNNTQYAPIDGNEFEWGGFTYKVIVKEYEDGSKLAWLDRNLGASQVATSSNDVDAYGDLYQWGRLADGHQKRTSGTVSTLSNEDQPIYNDFITAGSSPYDWRNPQNDSLWQGVNGINNPAPLGWRIPTEEEWEIERQSWNSNSSAGAYESPLKLTMAGRRNHSDGTFESFGLRGDYWSSTVDGTVARLLRFTSINADTGGSFRARGSSVRCVRNIT